MELHYRDLQTERLLLRRPRQGDARLVYDSFASDLEVTRYLTWRPHESIADAEAALASRLDRLDRGVEYSWLLERSGSRDVLGLISVWLLADAAEVGFVLARAYWRQGFMTEAVEAVTSWALAASGVHEVFGTCDVENVASARLLEKAGYASQGQCGRRIVRPNLGPDPRPSLLFVRRGAVPT
jgi:RimJ/RimL family protein N-acetyltransferase